MNPLEWINKATEETDEIWSSANSVLHGMLLDGSWEGTDPVEAARQVVASIVEPEVTSAFSGWVAVAYGDEWCVAPKDFWEANHFVPDHEADIEIPGFRQCLEHTFVSAIRQDEAESLRKLGFEVIEDWEW